jgi:competence protein ComEA
MRKIVGALILVVAAAAYRADDLARFRLPVESPAPRSVSDAAEAPRSAAGAPSSKKRGDRRTVPPGYKRNPLVFFSSAPKDSLMLLPGVGPVLADRIINARTARKSFNRWDDLLAIKGIGPKTVERLKKLAEDAESK